MVTIVKHEWHQVDAQFAYDLDAEKLSEIYPDLDEDEITAMLERIEAGEEDIEDIINEAWNNDVDIDWDRQYDDWWTDRKGGYDITYELGDEDSWVTPDTPPEPTHKCTKCKWTGQSYDADWKYPEEGSDEEMTKICPYCESETELTEVGLQKQKEHEEMIAQWEQEEKDAEKAVPCFSCGAMHKESELPEMNGHYHCPDCNEGWVMMDMREDDEDDDEEIGKLHQALEELKVEFDKLIKDESENKK